MKVVQMWFRFVTALGINQSIRHRDLVQVKLRLKFDSFELLGNATKVLHSWWLYQSRAMKWFAWNGIQEESMKMTWVKRNSSIDGAVSITLVVIIFIEMIYINIDMKVYTLGLLSGTCHLTTWSIQTCDKWPETKRIWEWNQLWICIYIGTVRFNQIHDRHQ